MAGGIGVLMNDYGWPLSGLGLLALGGWHAWRVWTATGTGRTEAFPLGVRITAVLLGVAAGWFLANLEYAPDPQHVTIGFPMPIVTLARHSGGWLEPGPAGSLPCLVLDLAVGVGLGHGLLLGLARLTRGLGRARLSRRFRPLRQRLRVSRLPYR